MWEIAFILYKSKNFKQLFCLLSFVCLCLFFWVRVSQPWLSMNSLWRSGWPGTHSSLRFYFILNVRVFCPHVCYTWEKCPWRSEEVAGHSRTGVTNGLQVWDCGCWKLITCPLEKQPRLNQPLKLLKRQGNRKLVKSPQRSPDVNNFYTCHYIDRQWESTSFIRKLSNTEKRKYTFQLDA